MEKQKNESKNQIMLIRNPNRIPEKEGKALQRLPFG